MSELNTAWISGWNPENPKFWESEGKFHRPAQPDLFDPRRASWFLDLADLEHRRDQTAAGRVSLLDRSAISARGVAGADRLADAVSLHLRGDHLWRPQLDGRQRGIVVHPDHPPRLFRDPARHIVRHDAAG